MFAADIRFKSKFTFMLGRLPNGSMELFVFLLPANKWRSHNLGTKISPCFLPALVRAINRRFDGTAQITRKIAGFHQCNRLAVLRAAFAARLGCGSPTGAG